MATRKVNKTDPRNVAKPVSQLRGAAKQARIAKVTKAEAGPATVRGGMAPGAGRSKPIGTGGGGVTKPSGTAKMVNAQKPGMQKLVRKAAQARKANAGRPLVKPAEAQRLMSQRAPGIRKGAAQLRQQTAGTLSPGATARAQARGQAEAAKAQARRGARAASQRMQGVLNTARTVRNVVGALKTLGRGSVAAAVMDPRPVGDATLSAALKRGDYKPKQGPAPKTTQSSFNKKSFDDAFRTARKSGAKLFTWRGKRYTTEMK